MNTECFGSVQVTQTDHSEAFSISSSYDLALCVLSWERRATHAFLNVSEKISRLHALWFLSQSDEVEAKKVKQHSDLAQAHDSCDEIRLGKSVDVDENYVKLSNFFRSEFKRVGRPLRIVIDMTCLPKNYLMFLLGLGFNNDMFARLDCVYSAGKYDLVADDRTTSPSTRVSHRSLTSEGDWVSRQVPFFGSGSVSPKIRDLIVTVGGEIGLTVTLIEKVEPRNLYLVFIRETAPGPTQNMLESERKAYEYLVSEPKVSEYQIGLNDAVEVGRHCTRIAAESDADGLSIMLLGSKSHALGAGLAALAKKNIEVVCRVPTGYKFNDVVPTGDIFVYSIEDRFEPLNYLE